MTLDMGDLIEDMATSDSAVEGIMQTVSNNFRRLGFSFVSKPEYEPPALPRSVTRLTDDELTDVQSELVTWMEYAGEQAALQDMLHKAAKQQQENLVRKIRLKAVGTVAEREDRARTHPRVLKIQDLVASSRGTHMLIMNRYNSYDTARKVCSRDFERRIKLLEGYKRDGSVRGKKVKRGPYRQSELEPGGRRGSLE